ncbi:MULTISPECIES: DUF4352 domain-containing protein [unclassified Paenibacillus]|uniref:DUF4352 domain-containing protein n=1 Tax=unclassified Paenibacillus TaxID=185978 RepID=UPI0030F70FD7
MKKFISGFVAGALVFGGASAFAASGLLGQKVQGVFTIEKDGAKIAEAAIINGSAYAPLRAVADATGTDIGIQGKKIIIGSSTGTASSTGSASNSSSTQTSASTSRSKPAALGQTVNFNNKDYGFSGTASITEVFRGQFAWQKIKDANMFNDEAGAGYEYILAKVNVKITNYKESDAAVHMTEAYFKLISTTGTAYDYVTVVTPDPSINTDIYVGSSHEGYVAFKVKQGDTSPLIAFARSYDGTGGAWFKTN